MTALEERDRDHMGGLAKGLRLLECFDAAHVRLTVSEAAQLASLSAASARRCLLTLCALGYLRSDGKHFAMDHGALRIGYAYAASTQLPRLIQPALDALSERSRESASLAVPVFDRSGAIAAAMSISTRAERMTVAEMAKAYLPALLRAQAWAAGQIG